MDKSSASYKLIEAYIKRNQYTWTVKDILAEYEKKINGWYVSYTANDVIQHCETEIKVLLGELEE